MTLTIGTMNYWNQIVDGTLTVRHYGALRSSFSATLNLSNTRTPPLVGQEILLKDGETLIWGGILIECEMEFHSPVWATVKLRGQGYEHLIQKFCFPAAELPEMTPSQAAEHLFSTYYPATEGVTLGTVEGGTLQKNEYQFYPAKASSVFDYLAKENGFLWWVDKNKTFYMMEKIPQNAGTVCIDLTEEDTARLKDLQTFRFRASTAGFRNVLYAFNKTTNTAGWGWNSEYLTRMMQRYGSGQYGAATPSSVVYSTADGERLAGQILESVPGTDEVEFSTDSDAFSLGQILSVTAPLCGLKTARPFCVTEIRSVYFANRFRYTVTANETSGGSLSPNAWENTLAGRTNTEAR